ncbi:hypothetical protein J6590_079885 [Homalodisca vitripennis]|nr:hypothetical protein J6590_079885 [Homalodisca vitripennis]
MQELDTFSSQLLHQKVRFSAHGFFVIDFTLINTTPWTLLLATSLLSSIIKRILFLTFRISSDERGLQIPGVKFVTSVIGVVITYIVILIQFQMSNQ